MPAVSLLNEPVDFSTLHRSAPPTPTPGSASPTFEVGFPKALFRRLAERRDECEILAGEGVGAEGEGGAIQPALTPFQTPRGRTAHGFLP